ncbi:MAG: hypothetical protein R2824_35825 [Saprospiraceae bacterium]|nr:hypothetical protein [Lewinella sp.]
MTNEHLKNEPGSKNPQESSDHQITGPTNELNTSPQTETSDIESTDDPDRPDTDTIPKKKGDDDSSPWGPPKNFAAFKDK